jgi:hypothetical protein
MELCYETLVKAIDLFEQLSDLVALFEEGPSDFMRDLRDFAHKLRKLSTQ